MSTSWDKQNQEETWEQSRASLDFAQEWIFVASLAEGQVMKAFGRIQTGKIVV